MIMEGSVATSAIKSSFISPRYADAVLTFDQPSTHVSLLKNALAAKTTQVRKLMEESNKVDDAALDVLRKETEVLQEKAHCAVKEKEDALDWVEELHDQLENAEIEALDANEGKDLVMAENESLREEVERLQDIQTQCAGDSKKALADMQRELDEVKAERDEARTLATELQQENTTLMEESVDNLQVENDQAFQISEELMRGTTNTTQLEVASDNVTSGTCTGDSDESFGNLDTEENSDIEDDDMPPLPGGAFDTNAISYDSDGHNGDQACESVKKDLAHAKLSALSADEVDALLDSARKKVIEAASSVRRLPQGVRKTGYGKFESIIWWRSKRKRYIGTFDTPEQASAAYMSVKKDLDDVNPWTLGADEMIDAIFDGAKKKALESFGGFVSEERDLPTGVYKTKRGKFRSQIRWGDKKRHICTVDTPEQASSAYLSVKKDLDESKLLALSADEVNALFEAAKTKALEPFARERQLPTDKAAFPSELEEASVNDSDDFINDSDTSMVICPELNAISKESEFDIEVSNSDDGEPEPYDGDYCQANDDDDDDCELYLVSEESQVDVDEHDVDVSISSNSVGLDEASSGGSCEALPFVGIANPSGNKNTAKWNDRLFELKDFKEENGHCLVPQRYQQLGKWVHNQRQQYSLFKKGEDSAMTQERIAKLNEIGFVWDASDMCPAQINEAAWTARFAELVAYKTRHNNCLVPAKYEANKQLAKWVDKQREQYQLLKKGKNSTMTDERIAKLEKIGFVWDANEAAWTTRFVELVAYKQEHGDCNVPRNYGPNEQLGRWVFTQRYHYQRWNKGKKANITEARIAKLDAIEFEWKGK